MIDVIIRKRGLKIMRFTKMHGIGNDYVYVNCLEENVENPSELSIKVSDRHFGIGSDGLILIKPSEKADFEMEMYNADGQHDHIWDTCVPTFLHFNIPLMIAAIVAAQFV